MPVPIECPCGHRCLVADRHAGHIVRCPGCNNPVKVSTDNPDRWFDRTLELFQQNLPRKEVVQVLRDEGLRGSEVREVIREVLDHWQARARHHVEQEGDIDMVRAILVQQEGMPHRLAARMLNELLRAQSKKGLNGWLTSLGMPTAITGRERICQRCLYNSEEGCNPADFYCRRCRADLCEDCSIENYVETEDGIVVKFYCPRCNSRLKLIRGPLGLVLGIVGIGVSVLLIAVLLLFVFCGGAFRLNLP